MDKKNVIGDSRISEEKRKKYLKNRLKRYVYDQKEMDVEEVKDIVRKLNEMEPEEPLDKAAMRKRIQEASKLEMSSELGTTEKLVGEAADIFMPVEAKPEPIKGKHTGSTKRSRKFGRPAIVAAALAAAVFVGANIGTYATEKMNVFQYVGELRNGTAFRVSGDAPVMEKEKEIDTYYSWNEVPNEYREYLIIPQGIPEELFLYHVRIYHENTFDWLQINYLDKEAKKNLDIVVSVNQNQEFTFGVLSYIENFECISAEEINSIFVKYYEDENKDIFAQFIKESCSYTLYGSVDIEVMKKIVKQTIEYNF